jgi:uncharacterized membrane protein
MGDESTNGGQERRQPPAWLGMGALIGIGAGFGLVLGVLLDNMVMTMLAGAALGTVAGAVVETQRAKK